jgi:RHS repeat-associated protein
MGCLKLSYYNQGKALKKSISFFGQVLEKREVPQKIVLDYYPYGKLLRQYVASDEKYISTHHERDEETNLDYRNARYSDFDIPRFLAIDPLASERFWLSPYNYVQNNPIMRRDLTGELDDEFEFNIETGESKKVSDKGGSEKQYVNYTNNKGEALGTHIVEGSEAFVGKTSNGWVASRFNLWEGLTEGYNSHSGYEYSYSDLKMRYWIMNSPNSYSGYATAIKNNEANGMADPITAGNYWDKYGDFLGRMKLMEFYITTADGLLSAEGVNGMRRGRTASFGNFNLASKTQIPSSFSVYLKSQKGVDVGKYKGKGEWMKQQAIKYNKLKK